MSQYYGLNYQPIGRTRWISGPGPQFDLDPLARGQLEEGQRVDACMRAKGYERAL